MTVRFRLTRWLYSIGVAMVVWSGLVPLTLGRILIGRATIGELRERLWGAAFPPRPRIIVHGVSAGEMNAAESLVARLAGTTTAVLLTTGTRAGMVSAERLAASRPHVEACIFLPWDRRAVEGWLRSLGAAAVVVMETEIWPNLFAACGTLGVPLFIVNGRVRPRDVPRYRIARRFFRDVLEHAAWIGAQSTDDRDRFVAIGARADRVEVTGNLKFDVPDTVRALPEAMASMVGRRPMLVGGSTHEPEERLIFDCALRLRSRGRAVTAVVAPRDASRAARVIRLARRRALTPMLWSALRQGNPRAAPMFDVLVVDEYGWLPSFYAAADVVVLGGTIAPIGGHNIIEPAARGCAIVAGPRVESIAAIVQRLEAAGGIVRLAETSLPPLVDACDALLQQPDWRRALGAAARAIVLRERGAAARSADAIVSRINVRLARQSLDGLRRSLASRGPREAPNGTLNSV